MEWEFSSERLQYIVIIFLFETPAGGYYNSYIEY